MATAKEVQETKQMVREAMIEDNVSPETLLRLGIMAEDVLKDKSLYPEFLQAIVDSDLAEEEDIEEGIDYQLIGVIATLGEMTRQMIASGEIEA
jgi:capsular polysaccharide biosynthesis protein